MILIDLKTTEPIGAKFAHKFFDTWEVFIASFFSPYAHVN